MEIFMRMPGQLLGNEIYKAFVQLLLRLTHFKASRWNRGGLSWRRPLLVLSTSNASFTFHLISQ
jgi:hypothetical protein